MGETNHLPPKLRVGSCDHVTRKQRTAFDYFAVCPLPYFSTIGNDRWQIPDSLEIALHANLVPGLHQDNEPARIDFF